MDIGFAVTGGGRLRDAGGVRVGALPRRLVAVPRRARRGRGGGARAETRGGERHRGQEQRRCGLRPATRRGLRTAEAAQRAGEPPAERQRAGSAPLRRAGSGESAATVPSELGVEAEEMRPSTCSRIAAPPPTSELGVEAEGMRHAVRSCGAGGGEQN